MTAIDFVKEHGINEAKRIVSTYPNHTHVTNDARIFINSEAYKKSVPHFADSVDAMVKITDLKQIVEAWELVESKGGIVKARKEAACLHSNDFDGAAFRIYDAINLVEQCQ